MQCEEEPDAVAEQTSAPPPLSPFPVSQGPAFVQWLRGSGGGHEAVQQPGLARLAALAAWVLLGQPLTLPLNIKGHGSAWLVARALAKHAHQPRLPLSRI